GLEWVHIRNKEPNNVFNISFQTDFHTSHGLAHILEHTTLCGSTGYPIRDPFFKMLKRSMATFMNALTADDLTMYPFSTMNKTDYYNLMDVYLDAVFFPLLKETDFKQEGWRLEHENPLDPSTPIVFKGVVYNEMKGVLSDVSSLFYYNQRKHLYDGTNYSQNSGGDPSVIPQLTHQMLLDFHKTKYHPSNGKIFTFGSFPLEEQMQKVEDRIQGFEKVDKSPLQSIKKWSAPKSVQTAGPVDPLGKIEEQNRVALSWVTDPSVDIVSSYTTKLITDLLVDGASAPLYRSLIESQLATDFLNTGFDDACMDANVSVGVSGVHQSNIDKIQPTILETIEQVVKSGFPQKQVQGLLHLKELGLKRKTSKFPMHLGWNTLMHMNHGGDPLDAVDVHHQFTKLKEKVQQPKFLEQELERLLLNNQHRLELKMTPDPAYSSEQEKREQVLLSERVSKLLPEDKQKVLEDGKTLLEKQSKEEDVSVLPLFPLDQIAPEPQQFPLTKHKLYLNKGVTLDSYWRQSETNGLSYLYLVWNLSDLDPSLVPYLSLLSQSLSNLGTKSKSFADFDDQVRLSTTGIHASTPVVGKVSDPQDGSLLFTISTAMMDHNVNAAYDCLKEALNELNFDDLDTLKNCLSSLTSERMHAVTDQGHVFCLRGTSALVSPAARVSQKIDGTDNILFLDQLQRQDMSQVSKRLQELYDLIFKQHAYSSLVIADQEMHKEHKKRLVDLGNVLSINLAKPNKVNLETKQEPGQVFKYPLETQVNYVARVIETPVGYTHEDAAPLGLLSNMITTQCHKELREKGGAYGAGCRFNPSLGLIQFYTYRDPNTDKTLAKFSEIIDNASEDQFITEQKLVEAKLSLMQALDAPVENAQEGLLEFQNKLSPETVSLYRNRILKATVQDVKRVTKYLQGNSADGIIGQ
ncbi:peptidase M16C associated-domain-containing protein, partial [Gorgonomyces haynaldii]